MRTYLALTARTGARLALFALPGGRRDHPAHHPPSPTASPETHTGISGTGAPPRTGKRCITEAQPMGRVGTETRFLVVGAHSVDDLNRYPGADGLRYAGDW